MSEPGQESGLADESCSGVGDGLADPSGESEGSGDSRGDGEALGYGDTRDVAGVFDWNVPLGWACGDAVTAGGADVLMWVMDSTVVTARSVHTAGSGLPEATVAASISTISAPRAATAGRHGARARREAAR